MVGCFFCSGNVLLDKSIFSLMSMCTAMLYRAILSARPCCIQNRRNLVSLGPETFVMIGSFVETVGWL